MKRKGKKEKKGKKDDAVVSSFSYLVKARVRRGGGVQLFQSRLVFDTKVLSEDYAVVFSSDSCFLVVVRHSSGARTIELSESVIRTKSLSIQTLFFLFFWTKAVAFLSSCLSYSSSMDSNGQLEPWTFLKLKFEQFRVRNPGLFFGSGSDWHLGLTSQILQVLKYLLARCGFVTMTFHGADSGFVRDFQSRVLSSRCGFERTQSIIVPTKNSHFLEFFGVCNKEVSIVNQRRQGESE